jgi:hypothetical protein
VHLVRIGSSHSLSEIASVSNNSLSQTAKKYLKDYPDSDKTYYPEYRLTEVKDSSGYILRVSDQVKDSLVLEDPSESKLQQLARRYTLGFVSGPEVVTLHRQMLAEFSNEDIDLAVKNMFADHHALFSPEAREFSFTMMKIIAVRKSIDQWWERNTHTGPDGKRRANRDANVWEVFKYYGTEISEAHAYLRRHHPIAVTSVKVSVTALSLFFLHSLRSSFSRPLSQPKLSIDSISNANTLTWRSIIWHILLNSTSHQFYKLITNL